MADSNRLLCLVLVNPLFSREKRIYNSRRVSARRYLLSSPLNSQIKALALSTYHLCLPSSIATCPRPRHSSYLDYYISDSMQAAYLHPSSSAMSSTPFARHPDNRHSQLLTPVSHFPSRMLPPPGTTPRILPGGGKIHVRTQLIPYPK